jgi:hypothetical protein
MRWLYTTDIGWSVDPELDFFCDGRGNSKRCLHKNGIARNLGVPGNCVVVKDTSDYGTCAVLTCQIKRERYYYKLNKAAYELAKAFDNIEAAIVPTKISYYGATLVHIEPLPPKRDQAPINLARTERIRQGRKPAVYKSRKLSYRE